MSLKHNNRCFQKLFNTTTFLSVLSVLALQSQLEAKLTDPARAAIFSLSYTSHQIRDLFKLRSVQIPSKSGSSFQ